MPAGHDLDIIRYTLGRADKVGFGYRAYMPNSSDDTTGNSLAVQTGGAVERSRNVREPAGRSGSWGGEHGRGIAAAATSRLTRGLA